LKTLEEPPFSTIIILLVNSVSSLLKTIISRCQIIKFKNLTDDEKINILQKSTTKDLAEINNALLLSGGDVSKTLDFLEDEEANAVITKFINLQKGLASKRNSSAIHKEFESLTKEKEIFGKFLDFLINRISSDDLSSQNNLIFLEQLLKSKKFFNRNVNPKLISNWLYLQNLKILD
jgi:DNA polymerase-3 subunit delta'